METAPDLTGGETSEETSEVSSPNESPTEPANDEWVMPEPQEPTAPLDSEEFNLRVERLMEMMENDPKVRDRLIAETYVNFASAEMGIRGMYEMFQTQGMAGLMKGAFRRGG